MTELQKITLGIYKDVAKLCQENGIRYYAIGGTCVGAARHHGFIPWDDDLDIAMPIEDYTRFLELCKTSLPEHLSLYSAMTVSRDPMLFIKIMDNRTTMIEERFIRWKEAFEGVWIDIMPMSGVPADKKEQKKFIKKLYVYQRLEERMKDYFRKERYKTLFSKVSYVLALSLRILPRNYFGEKRMSVLKEHPFDSAEYTGYTWSIALARLIFPKSWFADYVELPFEDTVMRCPVEYDKYLTQQFGDYMQYPPEDKRNSGHDFAVFDLEHSYKDYQSGKLSVEDAIKRSKS